LSAVQLFELYSKKEKNTYERGNKHLKAMKQNCFRLIRIINNLIDISKIEIGFLELHLKDGNIISLVENITSSVAEYAKGKNINVQFDTEVKERNIAYDPDKLERIMLNLLSNAIKFTEKGGNIFVKICQREENIIISIRDTGIGIPQSKADKIFDRFIQVENTLTKSHEGSGMGLSITKAFVEMHGGAIKLKTQEGAGSEFIIELPVRILKEKCIPDHIDREVERNCVEILNIEFSDIYL
jgi:signal transduction histidine kinase